TAIAATTAVNAAQKKSILSIKDTITDNAIVYPASFETDTREMMKNWYLQNFAVLDKDVEKRSSATVSDEEYIRRLKAIPSGIELPFNQVVRSHIETYIKKRRTLVEQMLGMSLYYMPIFEQALEKVGLPLELKYIPVIESALNPNAVSPAGASGLWQFMLSTGKGMGLEVNSLVDERRDPYRSSDAAAKYFKQLYNIYGDWSLAIAAYNCGPGNVNKAIRRVGDIERPNFWEIYYYLPAETRGYVPAFIAATYVMTYFKEHNISPGLASKPLLIDTVQINRRININQISQVLNIPIDEIRILNPQYRKDIIPGDTHPYMLALPSQQIYSYIMAEDSIASYRSDIYGPGSGYVAVGGSIQSVSSSDENAHYEDRQVATIHNVQKGETASSIAQKYGMNLDDLLVMNGLRDEDLSKVKILKVMTMKKVKVDGDGIVDVTGISTAQTTPPSSSTSFTVGNETAQNTSDVPMPVKQTTQKQTTVPERPMVEKVETNVPSQQSERVDKSFAKANEVKSTTPAQNVSTGRNKGYKGNQAATNAKHQRQKVKATPPAPTTHTVQKGESLTKIAKKYGTTVADLQKANNIKGDKIEAGKSIKLPGKGNAAGGTTNKTASRKRRR
ncbi:MAG: transglycosylase SLT domain-containing protein, partial [Muribaculaceae bacterium]|nr:transglycosylase SLT domain-containing protein [Muribaculaceae bacterium]